MKSRDDGMTLIELIISMALLTVVMAGLTTAFLLVLDTTESTKAKVTDSTGAQLLTSYLVSDVQSSDSVQPTTGGCGGLPLLELKWADASSGAVTDVQYVLESNSNGNFQLARYRYDGSCGLQDKTVIVRAVSTATCTSPCDSTARQIGLNVTALSKDAKTGNYSSYTFQVLGSRRTK